MADCDILEDVIAPCARAMIKAEQALHKKPASEWTLEELNEQGMLVKASSCIDAYLKIKPEIVAKILGG